MKSLVLLSALALGPLPSPARAGPAELTAAQAAAARAGAGIVAYRRPWFLADRHLWIWTTSPPAARTPPRGGGAGRGDAPETRP